MMAQHHKGWLSTSSEGDDSELRADNDPQSIVDIYSDAEAFERVLEPHEDSDSGLDIPAFTKLVGQDLNEDEAPWARRIVQLAAASRSEIWLQDGEFTSEPDSIDEGDRERVDQEQAFNEQQPRSEESWKLDPEQAMKLLIEEFGPLTSETEHEVLVHEADACLHYDVLILGVVHLTSHRLSFHASLLSTQSRPDILRAGPVVVRKGWRSRRLWLELSHDMLSTYASSSDEDRLKPLYSTLLSNVAEVAPFDPQRPRRGRFRMKSGFTGTVEFDTEESAQLWRREIDAAIFFYRHKRGDVLEAKGKDNETSGIRISIPLDRISRVDKPGKHTPVRQLHVELDGSDIPEELKRRSAPEVFSIAILNSDEFWREVDSRISIAKQRTNTSHEAFVIADFGPLSYPDGFDHSAHVSDANQSNVEQQFRQALALEEEVDLWLTRCNIFHCFGTAGFFGVSSRFVGFWCKSTARRQPIQYRLAIGIVKEARIVKSRVKFFPVHALALELDGHEDLKFQFSTASSRDEAMRRVNDVVQKHKMDAADVKAVASEQEEQTTLSKIAPHERAEAVNATLNVSREATSMWPKVVNITRSRTLPALALRQLDEGTGVSDAGGRKSLHFMCLTIGSRGDVQPYIALGLGLMRDGHEVTIVTHEEYKAWIEGYGIKHRQAGGDPGALMKLSVENKMFSPDFFRESLTNFRQWLDDLLLDAWEACKDADVLLESPSAMAGVHIAEALDIPYFRTFTMPWTKTSEFPQPFLSPPVESPVTNSTSYILFNNVMWRATSGQINRWRRNTLQIGNTDMGHLAQSKITFIYNFSQSVVPKPLDWGDNTIISGYWFLDNPDPDWSPPESIMSWMQKARADNKPIVYIGFGSITVPSPNRVTSRIIKAVLKSDVRAIISKGWSARMSKAGGDGDVEEPAIPLECYMLDRVPHDWLFPKIDAAFHHGGAGTTGASLRAGIVTLIHPWFGDQYFWASRVHKLGAGIRVASLKVGEISDALTKATSNRVMREKAAAIGARIRAEDGVTMAIDTMYTYMSRATRYRTMEDSR